MQLADRGIKRYMFGDKAFYKMVFAIIIPIIVQNAITSFVNLLDNIMVGQLGTEMMSGVAIANQLMFIFQICIFGAISGASIYGAQFFGAKDYENMRASTRFKFYICLGLFLIAGAVFLFFSKDLVSLYLTSGESQEVFDKTLSAGTEYLLIMIIGLLPFALSQVYSSMLREAGETMLPMVSGIAAVITNMVFNYILIFGNFGAPKMGVAGAAIATVISRYVELAIIVIGTHKNTKKYFFFKGMYSTFKVPIALTKRIIVRGFPLLLNEGLWALGMSFIMQLYSVRGLNVVAGMNIASTVTNLFNTVVFAMGNAVAILVGQALGADEIEKAKLTAWRLIFFSVFSSIALGVLLAITSPFIPYIYNTSAEVRKLATDFMLILAASMSLFGIAHCCYFTMRSGGKTIITFVFDSLSVWVINVPIVYALVHFTDMGILGVYAISQFSNIIKCVLGLILIKKGVWIHNVTREIA